MKETMDTTRLISKLDALLNQNNTAGAEEFLIKALRRAQETQDKRAELLIHNECIGLYRKLGRRYDALSSIQNALNLIRTMKIEDNVGAATTYINCGTAYKAFDMPDAALPLFEDAQRIYNTSLQNTDPRFGGLYNNMALTLVDLQRFDEAYVLYDKAIEVMRNVENGMLEVAITYLNIANAKEAEMGLELSEPIVMSYMAKAMRILDAHENRDGYYAFVCDKCASVFGYYGFFKYRDDLLQRAREIYERS